MNYLDDRKSISKYNYMMIKGDVLWKISSNQLWLSLLWKQSVSYVVKPLMRLFGQGIWYLDSSLSTPRTLNICYSNITIMKFSQMIKVLLVQSILILSINLLKRRYTNIVFIAMDRILVDPLIKGLGGKLFMNEWLKWV